MRLVPFWFIVITVLWTGFFVLEGFDFGVGMLHGIIGKDEAGRRAAINTIGPLWDGNEVWLIVAGASMFAAFPGWYATMFSGFYLALVLLLVALIVRGVSFEYRGKGKAARWLRTWDAALTAGSLAAPLLIGVALGDLLHGATFLSLKTTGDMRERAGHLARRVAPVTAVAVLAFISWTHASAGKGALLNPIEFTAVLAAFAAVWLAYEHREGWAFTMTTVTMAACIISIFTDLYPRVMVSSTNAAYDLTVHNTASGAYSLKVMTVVAVIFLPFVLAYQTWTYYVFRRRISQQEFQPPPQSTPAGAPGPSAASPQAGAPPASQAN